MAFSRDRFAISGGAFALSTTICRDPDGSGGCFREFTLWDGGEAAAYDQATGQARVLEGKSAVLERVERGISRNDWSASLAWYPITQSGGLHPQDLLAIVSEESTTIQETEPTIGGLECVVVDRKRTDGSIAATFWLAKDRGLVPLRQEHFAPDGQLLLVRTITEPLVLPNGACIPIAGERVVYPLPSDPDLQGGLSYHFEVALDGTGVPIASCVPKIDEFELLLSLPGGHKSVRSVRRTHRHSSPERENERGCGAGCGHRARTTSGGSARPVRRAKSFRRLT